MLRTVRLIHLLSFSALVGFMAIVQVSLVPAQNRLDGFAYARLEKGMNDTLEWLTASLFVVALVSAVAVALLSRRLGGRTMWTAWLAVAAVAAMVVSTLTINAPINWAIDGWDPAALPVDWMALRNRWELGHAIRTAVGLGGLIAALVSTIWSPPPATSGRAA